MSGKQLNIVGATCDELLFGSSHGGGPTEIQQESSKFEEISKVEKSSPPQSSGLYPIFAQASALKSKKQNLSVSGTTAARSAPSNEHNDKLTPTKPPAKASGYSPATLAAFAAIRGNRSPKADRSRETGEARGQSGLTPTKSPPKANGYSPATLVAFAAIRGVRSPKNSETHEKSGGSIDGHPSDSSPNKTTVETAPSTSPAKTPPTSRQRTSSPTASKSPAALSTSAKKSKYSEATPTAKATIKSPSKSPSDRSRVSKDGGSPHKRSATVLPRKRRLILMGATEFKRKLAASSGSSSLDPKSREASFVAISSIHNTDVITSISANSGSSVAASDQIGNRASSNTTGIASRPTIQSASSPPTATITHSSGRFVGSELHRMRVRNLKEGVQPVSPLLVQALLRQNSPAMRALIARLEASGQGLRPGGFRFAEGALEFDYDSRLAQRRIDGFIGTMDSNLLTLCTHLLSTGANPNFSDCDGNQPLALAIQYRNGHKLVELLLQKGADANSTCHSLMRGEKGSTLTMLDLAVEKKCVSVCELILRHGGMPSMHAPVRLLPFAKSLKETHPEFYNLASRAVQQLFWAAVDGDGGGEAGPEQDGGMSGNDEQRTDDLRACFRAGLHPDACRRRGQTGLTSLVRGCGAMGSFLAEGGGGRVGSLAVMELLLEHRADPNAVDVPYSLSGQRVIRPVGLPLPMAVYPLLRHGPDASKTLSLLARYGLDPESRVGCSVDGSELEESMTLIEFARQSHGRADSLRVLEELVASRGT